VGEPQNPEFRYELLHKESENELTEEARARVRIKDFRLDAGGLAGPEAEIVREFRDLLPANVGFNPADSPFVVLRVPFEQDLTADLTGCQCKCSLTSDCGGGGGGT